MSTREDELAQKLSATYDRLSESERLIFRSYLNSVVSDSMSRCINPEAGTIESLTVRSIIQFLAARFPTGLLCRGYVDTHLFFECLSEAKALAEVATTQNQRSKTVAGGFFAKSLSHNRMIIESISGTAKSRVKPSGHTSYLYYSGLGAGLNPHVDRSEYAINVLVLLEHISEGIASSQLVLWLDKDTRVPISLGQGEWVAFHAAGTVHGRSDCGDGETVTVLSLGFELATGEST